MGDQSGFTYSSILLEIIASDILIALNVTTLLKVTQTEDNQAANKLSTKNSSSIFLDTERYIDEEYVTKNLKKELFCETQRYFSLSQGICDSYVREYIATLKEFLKNEVSFLRRDLNEKKLTNKINFSELSSVQFTKRTSK